MSEETREIDLHLEGGREAYDHVLELWRSGRLLEIFAEHGIDPSKVKIKDIRLQGGSPLEMTVTRGEDTNG